MKQVFLSTLVVGVLLLPASSPAWARSVGGLAPHGAGHEAFGGRVAAPAPAHSVVHGSRVIVGPGYFRGRPFVRDYDFYGPTLGWGFAYDPFWYGPRWGYRYGVEPYGVTGGLRLEVTPKTADVYVDGYYAGVIDHFNGHFQHLDLVPGGHHIEVRAPGFQTLAFDTYIQPDHTTDYKGTLIPAPGTGR